LQLESWRLDFLKRLENERARFEAECKRLSPRNGEIAVGGAHFDAFVRSEGLAELMNGIRSGKTLADSLKEAVAHTSLCVRKWNESRRRDYPTHRWELMEESYLWDKIRGVQAYATN